MIVFVATLPLDHKLTFFTTSPRRPFYMLIAKHEF